MAQQVSRPDIKMPSMGGRPVGGGPNRFAPGAKPKNAKGTLMRIISIYMRWAKTIFVAMLLTVLSSVISVAIPLYVGKTFNTFKISTRTVDTKTLKWLLLIIVSLYAANWLISCLNGVIMLRVSQKLVFVLRTEFFE
jgi:ATP-binding cassette, subfamily B, multidrug efflux pump